MEEYPYKIKKYRSWESFKKILKGFSDDWIFRGQSDAKWDLKTSLERSNFANYREFIELDFLAEFQRGARNYLNENETPNNLIEWVTLMQHFGAPTRLLDFSNSIYIASYFAFENVEDCSSTAIWAINKRSVLNMAIIDYNNYFVDEKTNIPEEKTFEKIYIENDNEFIIPIEPFRMNKRYFLQQSVFLLPACSETPFMKQLDFMENKKVLNVIKFILPSKLQNNILNDLNKMNINRSTLFPDLEGYAKNLKMRYNSTANFNHDIVNRLEAFRELVRQGIIEDREGILNKNYITDWGKKTDNT